MNMTEEDKRLLLTDLCARWMPGLKCESNTKNSIVAYCTVDGIKRNIKGGLVIELTDRDTDGNALASTSTNELDMVKPYLRPMSSMTEEEDKELSKIIWNSFWNSKADYQASTALSDFCYEHHLDNHGLIPKDLALEAPEGMYNTK